MNSNEITERIAKLKGGSCICGDPECLYNVGAALAADCDTLLAALAEAREAVEKAPHEPGCRYLQRFCDDERTAVQVWTRGECTCWKASVLTRITEALK